MSKSDKTTKSEYTHMVDTTKPGIITGETHVHPVNKVEITITNTDAPDSEPEKMMLSPNFFNIAGALQGWKDAHPDFDETKYVFTTSDVRASSPAQDKGGGLTKLTYSQIFNGYTTEALNNSDIESQLMDYVNRLMLCSGLMCITISAGFVHPQDGPMAMMSSTTNGYMDSNEPIDTCKKAMHIIMSKSEQYVDSGNIVVHKQGVKS